LRVGGRWRPTALPAALSVWQPDLVVLGEAYPIDHPQTVLDALRDIGLEYRFGAFSDTPNVATAVAMASRVPLSDVRQPLTSGPNRQRILQAVIGDVSIVAAYFPLNRAKVQFWREEFLPYARSKIGQATLMVGDWNSGAPYLDEAGATLYAAKEFGELGEAGWVDAWRSIHPEERDFSWYSQRPHLNGFRLDHAFISPLLGPRLISTHYEHSIRTSGASDHSAIVVDLHST
jgi:exodeoxyribonuclease III